jgi:hypothetical protein
MMRRKFLMPEPFDVTQIVEETHDLAGPGPSSKRLPRGQDYIDNLRSLAEGSPHNPDPVEETSSVSEGLHEDAINPSHYRKHPSGIECIEVTRHMNFNVGNAIKYLWRYMDKGDPVENLQKAQWYIDDEIRRLQGLR